MITFWAIFSLYIVWFLLSCVNQFNGKIVDHIREFDIFHLLPIWTFFAPNPGVSDYHLLYRLILNDGTMTNFTEIDLMIDRRIVSFIWNPSKRKKKVLGDLVRGLSRQIQLGETNKNSIKLSFSYIALLNFFSQLDLPNNTTELQFSIVESHGFFGLNEPSLIFCSDFHYVQPHQSV